MRLTAFVNFNVLIGIFLAHAVAQVVYLLLVQPFAIEESDAFNILEMCLLKQFVNGAFNRLV